MNTYAERIGFLRSLMRSREWDAIILTGSDPHGSEYPAERYKQIRWLTGFTGEAARLVVTEDHAGLWTDTRYFIQAAEQLQGSGVELHKTRVPGQILIPEWLAGHFSDSPEPVLAIDGTCTSKGFADEVTAAFEPTGNSPAIVSAPDFLSLLWTDRPPIPQTPIYTVESGTPRSAKLEMLRDFFRSKECDGILLSSLDEIAWTLNVRASDIEYNPMVISYLLVTEDAASWFVLKEPVEDPDSDLTFARVSEDGVSAEPYESLEDVLSASGGLRLFADSSTLNWQLASVMERSGVTVVSGSSPVGLAKAIKNSTEIEGMRQAHIRDGVAMVRFLCWLEKAVRADRIISEWDASVKLQQLRSLGASYQGESFETISAWGPGAALPHYVTPQGPEAPLLQDHGLYLNDSGGQYLDGTTDITRTVPLGDCTELEKEDYTLVLKGHIDLAMAIFPEGTPGCRLDALARGPLWRRMRNFGHGTGHGVGCFLGVHEGPQDIRQNLNPVPFEPGMIVSDEPGIYREGLHGVRHENLLLCVDLGSNEFGRWLCFEPLTLCPFDTSILVPGILDREETEWLDNYHRKVYDTLSPLLDQETASWLRQKCKKITIFAD
ncbi:MAG: aminopeptidase P family protein [Bacteroidales bacterium]|nr:aminopeptidase P family protein [Bacteroidales bacterium]